MRAGARVVTVLTSENGLDWTRATGDGFDLTVASIIEDRSRVTIGGAPDGYVMAGEICDPSCAWRAWFSPDGETWEAADARGLGERDVDGVAFPSVGALIQIETGVLAGGSASSDRQVTPYPAFLMTLDGDEWTIVDGAGPGQVGGVVAIARSSAGLVGITGPSLSDIQPDGMQIYWSPDGVTWQWVTSVSFFPTGGDRFIEGLAASGDWFLVYGSQGDRAFALMSPDGRTWTELDVPSFEGARMHSAAGDEHGFVVVGETCTDPETCDSVIWRWEAPPTE